MCRGSGGGGGGGGGGGYPSFHSFCEFVSQYLWNVWKYLCGNHDYAKSKKEADFVLKKSKEAENNFLTLWIRQRQLQDEMRNIYVWWLGVSYIRELTVILKDVGKINQF